VLFWLANYRVRGRVFWLTRTPKKITKGRKR
jgi:hypothetical protein